LSSKRTFFFILVLVAIAGVYYASTYKPALTKRDFSFTPEPLPSKILSLDTGEVVERLSIHDAARRSEIDFEKSGKQRWRITRPVNYPAESLIVSGMVVLLKTMPRNRSLSLEGVNASELGLDAPRLTVCVSTNERPEERCLQIGKEIAVGEGAYAKWADEEKYFLVGKMFVDSFDKTLYTMRKKQVFNLLEDELASIHFQSSQSYFELLKKGDQWVLVKPEEVIIESDPAHVLLTELNTIFVKEFLDQGAPEAAIAGLLQPDEVIRVIYKNESEKRISRGAAVVGKNAYYVELSDPRSIVLVSKGKFDKIQHAFEALVS